MTADPIIILALVATSVITMFRLHSQSKTIDLMWFTQTTLGEKLNDLDGPVMRELLDIKTRALTNARMIETIFEQADRDFAAGKTVRITGMSDEELMADLSEANDRTGDA